MKLSDAVKAARTVKVEHARRFATHVVPEVVRPARIIWNRAIGGIFLFFAISFFSYAGLHRENIAGIIGGIFLGLVMSFFSISSFLKARRIDRQFR